MKFGASLNQRSIPQWAHYNVDYDEIKSLIKAKTSVNNAVPVSIPGQNAEPESWKQFEDEIFELLQDQHRRVSLFARSKYGEMERRLAQLEKQVNQLQKRITTEGQDHRPLQHTQKFSKLVKEAESIGDQIQALARYTVTQRTAFRKILKKYQKWTDSQGLTKRFNKENLNRTGTALNPDFATPLDHLSSIQSLLRELSISSPPQGSRTNMFQVQSAEETTTPTKLGSILSRLNDLSDKGSYLDFDVALSTLPLGQSAGRACYWIHTDNLVEVRVLLLRHMRDLATRDRNQISRTSSVTSLSSRRTAIKSDGSGSLRPNENVQVALFDNLKEFLREQSAATIYQAEEVPGGRLEKAALSVYWTEDSQAVVVTMDSVNNAQQHNAAATPHDSKEAKAFPVRRKGLPSLVQPDQVLSKRPARESDEKSLGASDRNVNTIRAWLKLHPDVKPLAELQLNRTRFEGLHNSENFGTWAVLDTSIAMSAVETESLGMVQKGRPSVIPIAAESSASTFPHAVLEIRWEAGAPPDLIDILDHSHLVERVRGFSLDTHAVVTVCKPGKMPQPFWMPLLKRDIRKMPPPKASLRKSVSSEGGASAASKRAASSSAPSTADGPSGSGFSARVMNSSATSARDSAAESPAAITIESRKPRNHQHPHTMKAPEPTPPRRYWNEFDDGDERVEDEAYAIYVDPDAPSGFPGAETISKLWVHTSKTTSSSVRRLMSLFNIRSEGNSDPTRQPLLSAEGSRVFSYSGVDDTSDSEDEARVIDRSAAIRRRSAVLSRASSRVQKERQSREKVLFSSYVGCFVASFALLLVSGILQATGRHKAEFEVDAGVIVGVVMGLSFGITGTSLVLMRKEKLGLLHRAAVFLAFALICIASGVCLALLTNAVA